MGVHTQEFANTYIRIQFRDNLNYETPTEISLEYVNHQIPKHMSVTLIVRTYTAALSIEGCTYSISQNIEQAHGTYLLTTDEFFLLLRT